MMTTFVERLLDLADQKIERQPESSAIRRRAVSTAYYAAFHALAKSCAGTLLPDAAVGTAAYERVYRSLEHGSIRNAFQPKDSPLQRTVSLKRIGDLIVPLQSARMTADYAPPKVGFYRAGEAEDLIAEARRITHLLDALSPADRQVLATHLLSQVRKK